MAEEFGQKTPPNVGDAKAKAKGPAVPVFVPPEPAPVADEADTPDKLAESGVLASEKEDASALPIAEDVAALSENAATATATEADEPPASTELASEGKAVSSIDEVAADMPQNEAANSASEEDANPAEPAEPSEPPTDENPADSDKPAKAKKKAKSGKVTRLKPTDEHKRRANRAAAIVAACVAAFAGLFLGLVLALDHFGPSNDPGDIPVATKTSGNVFYVLLIGSDTRKGTALYTGKATDHAQVDQHSDVMTLMRVDPKNYTVSFLSIPRDTVINGEQEKINNALVNNNPQEVADAVQRLTGLKVDYYMMTTFATFANLIDALGGIDVDVPVDIKVDDPGTGSVITVKAGKNQHLDGAQALALARARHEYGENQDVIRQMNVRNIEAAIIQRVMSYHDIEDVEHLLAITRDDVQTNLDLPMVGLDIVEFMKHPKKLKIISGSGPYEGGGERPSDKQWVIPADDLTWKEVIHAFKRGEDPTKVVPLPKV